MSIRTPVDAHKPPTSRGLDEVLAAGFRNRLLIQTPISMLQPNEGGSGGESSPSQADATATAAECLETPPPFDSGRYRVHPIPKDGDCAYGAVISASTLAGVPHDAYPIGTPDNIIAQLRVLRRATWRAIMRHSDAQERAEELRSVLYKLVVADGQPKKNATIRKWLVRGIGAGEINTAASRMYMGTLPDGKGLQDSYGENTELLMLARLFGVVIAVHNKDMITSRHNEETQSALTNVLEKWVVFDGLAENDDNGIVDGVVAGVQLTPQSASMYAKRVGHIVPVVREALHYNAYVPRAGDRGRKHRRTV